MQTTMSQGTAFWAFQSEGYPVLRALWHRLCSVWHVMQMPLPNWTWCYAHSQAWPQPQQKQEEQEEEQTGLATIGLKFNFWLDFNVRCEARQDEAGEARQGESIAKFVCQANFEQLSPSLSYPPEHWETVVELVNLRQYLNKFFFFSFIAVPAKPLESFAMQT